MALPMILSLLGSTAAGAGMLGAMSPLLAGALGSGIGTAVETGDIGKGLSAGLTSGLLGGIGGRLAGNLAGNAATQTATGALTNNAATQAAAGAAGQEAAKQGILGGLLGNMQTGFQPGVAAADATMGQKLMQGLGGAGAMSGAGLGTMLGAGMMMEPPGPEKRERTEQAAPSNRERFTPPADFRAGYDPEFTYFSPQVPPAIRFQEGGPVSAAPGIAGIAGMAAPSGGENDKEVVARAAQAIEGRLPEAAAARALGAFLQRFGEQALRQLARDVTSGRGPRGGDGDGPVRGPGDGMSDTVPARMDDGSQDVLLSDGEFVVPADVVSGLGNGSTDAGVSELEDMMARVRRERTGTERQPPAMAAGGVLPA